MVAQLLLLGWQIVTLAYGMLMLFWPLGPGPTVSAVRLVADAGVGVVLLLPPPPPPPHPATTHAPSNRLQPRRPIVKPRFIEEPLPIPLRAPDWVQRPCHERNACGPGPA